MSEAKVEVLKIVLAIAYADGQVSPEEERLVDFLIDSSGLTAEEEEAVRAQHDATADLCRISALVTDPRERAKAYEQVALVSMMDGAQAAAESELLKKLRPTLAIADPEAEEIEAKARQIYERFMKKQRGEDDEEGGGE
jgi:uncharacterized membrane protein YebE (DUF533 family)